MNSSILKRFVFALSVVFFISCDSDYSNIGADIIDDDIHHNGIVPDTIFPIAYDRGTGAVQANNLPINSVGIYNNPAFGRTTAHFVTQLEMVSENPIIGANAVIDTVYLYVPYYSKLQSTGADGTGSYVVDSIYGNRDVSMKLSLYENGYFLRTTDPAVTGEVQKYFSDEKSLVDANKREVISQSSDFKFSSSEVKISYIKPGTTDVEVVKERLAPGMYIQLDKPFFTSKILNAPGGKLLNNSVFKDYFRGLYFNFEPNDTGNPDGAMAMANFAAGKIVMKYTEDGEEAGTRVSKSITLNLKGNTINFFENQYNSSFNDAIATFDETLGDDRLYVKGGDGSMAFITIPDSELNSYKESVTGQKILINEANLTFYVDQGAMPGGTEEPLRVYLYDVDNQRPLFDYFTDVTTNTGNNKYDKRVYGGNIQKDAGGRGKSYKIRITNHISNIINKDSTNVRLGLVVTENINTVSTAALKTPFQTGGKEVKTLPLTSVISPMGTVLYGSKAGVPADKRLKLEIFYTKPN